MNDFGVIMFAAAMASLRNRKHYVVIRNQKCGQSLGMTDHVKKSSFERAKPGETLLKMKEIGKFLPELTDIKSLSTIDFFEKDAMHVSHVEILRCLEFFLTFDRFERVVYP